VYALKSTIGTLKAFALRKRFGQIAEDEMAIDLTNAINSEVFGDMARKMYSNAVGNTNWSSAIPSGISEADHRKSLRFSLTEADSVLVGNAGRGTVSWVLGGKTVIRYLSDLPGYVKLYDGNSVSGAHLHGTLDGMPVIRITDTNVIPAAKAVLGFKGLSAFEAAAVYTPYMPLTSTAMLPMTNPLVSQRAAAVWAGVDILVKNFLTVLTIT